MWSDADDSAAHEARDGWCSVRSFNLPAAFIFMKNLFINFRAINHCEIVSFPILSTRDLLGSKDAKRLLRVTNLPPGAFDKQALICILSSYEPWQISALNEKSAGN